MKNLLVVTLLLLSLAVGLSAQTATETQTNLRKTIEYLASDKLEGRRTGEAGSTMAAGYVADIFGKLRLKPGLTDKKGKPSFMQPFPYVTGVDMAKDNAFSVALDQADGKRVTVENLLPVKPVGFSMNGTVKDATVVFAGYGIVANEAKYDDYQYDGQPIDVKGKVVLVFGGNPDNDNPHSMFGRFDVRTKALIAREKGAVGLLVISREANFDDDKLTKLGYDQSLGESAVPTFVVSRNTAQNILGVKESDLATLEGLVAMKKDASVKVHYGYRDTRPVVSFKVDLIKKSVDAYNVIGVLEGRDKVLKNEAIVIGAHYDHLGHGGSGSLAANSTEIHHGADDNASGTAAIIELARKFAAGRSNKRTIIFIAFSGEEEGLFGSNYYVNHPVFPLDKTVAMINLDMVGRLKDDKLTVGGMGTASEWKSLVESNVVSPPKNAEEKTRRDEVYASLRSKGFRTIFVDTVDGRTRLKGSVPRSRYASAIQAVMETPGLTAIVNEVKASEIPLKVFDFSLQLNEDGFGPSDHSSFYGKKIPVLFFFTGTHNDYHKPSDTADKINYEGEEKVVDYVASIVEAIDKNAVRPTYTVAKVTSLGGGRSGFNISLGTIPNYSDSTDGLLLDGVRDGSPAAKAGIKAGDKVIKLAGRDIRNVEDYTFVLGEMKAGEEYEVVVLRGGEKLTLKIVPVKRQ